MNDVVDYDGNSLYSWQMGTTKTIIPRKVLEKELMEEFKCSYNEIQEALKEIYPERYI